VIFHEGFTFRGSLGPTLVGHDQFAGYVDFVTETFGQYTTDILAMIEKGNRVGGKMRFYSFHRKELFECHRAAAMCGGQACQSSRFEGTKVRAFLCSATSTVCVLGKALPA
jgi:hypothetical protein